MLPSFEFNLQSRNSVRWGMTIKSVWDRVEQTIRERDLRHRHRGRVPFAGAKGELALQRQGAEGHNRRKRTGMPFPLT
jgi:hypothetical protein